MIQSSLRRLQAPYSLRWQFRLALLAIAVLVVAGGVTAIFALHETASHTRALAEARLVRLQQAQVLVQQGTAIERASRQMLAATEQVELSTHYDFLIEQLESLDASLSGLGDSDVSVLRVHAEAQMVRNSAHVVAQLRDSALRVEHAFKSAMSARDGLLQAVEPSAAMPMAVALFRLCGAMHVDQVRKLEADYERAAEGLVGLPSELLTERLRLQKGLAPGQLDDPFALRLVLIDSLGSVSLFDAELQRHVGSVVEATGEWSARLTDEYQRTVRELAEATARNQLWVAVLLAGSLVLAWVIARFFLDAHVLARLQTVSDYLRRDDNTGPLLVPVRGRDEVGEMARAVEQFMAARRQLAQLNAELELAKSDLERKVAERTEDLRSANAQLTEELRERHRAEAALASVNRALRMLSESNQTLIHAADEKKLLEDVCRIVVEVGGYAVAWVGDEEADSRMRTVAITGAMPETLEAVLAQFELSPNSSGLVREALDGGRAVVRRRDDRADFEQWPSAAESQGYQAVVALPLAAAESTFGVLGACSVDGDAFDKGELEILAELAGDLAFGILTLRARQEHARAEAALERSERHLRSIYENSPLAYQALDAQGRYTEVNAAWCSMTGLSREQALGGSFADHLLPASVHRLDLLLRTVVEDREVHGVEFEFRHADGRVLVAEMDAKIGYDGSGAFQTLHCLLHDITQRKIIERALLHHAAIVASSDDAIIGESLDGDITSWNVSAERMFGYSHDEIIGCPVTLLVPPALRDEEAMILQRIREGVTVSHFQTVRQRKDGSTVDVSMTVSPLKNAEGQTIGASMIARDITAQKRAEQELRLAATAFESQEGMFIADADGKVLRVNRAYTDVTGYGAEECIGRPPMLAENEHQDASFFAAMWDTVRQTGNWQGEVWNAHKQGHVYPEWRTLTAVTNDDGVLTHYVGTAVDITQRKAAEEEIRDLAFFDQLTRLPNRRLLLDRLKQALVVSSRNGRYGALLFIDLDDFKTLNDTFGHDMGDRLLKLVAERVRGCVREGDTVARVGGDEFVVVLEGLCTESTEAALLAQGVGEKIITALNAPYRLSGREHHSTPSVGATLFFDGECGLDELLKQADIAMYQAKAAGRNTLRFFNPDMQAALAARARLEADLRRGLIEGQFELYYQMQVNHGGHAVGAEALLRWRHPDRGLVSPLEFVSLAEDTGLILPLGRWVLDTACRQLVAWAANPHTAALRIAVNVSASQFREAGFVGQVQAALAESGADPSLLELELTESLLLDDIEDAVSKMDALRVQGVRFSLDDFGTGYSSLSYLKRLPLNQLKIDQSFVRDVLTDPNDAAIAQTIVALAHSLGLEVIAEGVETVEQRDFLASKECHAYQGYFFSRPLPADEFALLAMKVGGM